MNLESLIHAKLDGEITEAEHTQLEAFLRDDWQARRLYLELADQHARLLQLPKMNVGVYRNSVGSNRTIRWRAFALIATAASIGMLAFIVWPQRPVDTEAVSSGVAMLSQILEAEFSGNVIRSGDTITPGTLTLNSGLAQIEFFSGATVLIEGTAQIDILSAWEARCIRGRVRVHVPPAAKGFVIHAPGLRLEDLGTEFGLNVEGQDSAVGVFDGEVIAQEENEAPMSLKEGMTWTSTKNVSLLQDFLPVSELQGQIRQREQRRFEQWKKWSMESRDDARLIAYYPFKHWEDDRWDRIVNNVAEPRQKQRHGGAVGAQWTQGRWPGKDALEFKRPGDRVRINVDGAYSAITLTCWVKVDSVDKKYNSLLLTDGYDNGEPHWQIFEDGSLMFSIIYRPEDALRNSKYNQIYYSKPVFTAESLGRWHHLAVSYDSQSGEVIQYFDACEVGREISKLHQAGKQIVFGPCELGNWGLPTSGHPFPIRNLNGAIDEFGIYQIALEATELKAMFEQGKPE